MSKHARNCTASSFFTYEEKKKMGYGTQKVRLGGDSLLQFDMCALCLHSAVDPVCCSHGHLFCKECILESILKQKGELKQKKKAWDEQQKLLKEEEEDEANAKVEQKVHRFNKIEGGVLPSSVIDDPTRNTRDIDKLTKAESELKKVNSFWVPQMTPDAKKDSVPKPNKYPTCPAERHFIKSLKDLATVRYTNGVSDVREERIVPGRKPPAGYMCPMCSKTLTNIHKLVMPRKCGHVHCRTCLTTADHTCYVCSAPFLEKDEVALKGGGTGYAGHDGEALNAKKYAPAGWV